jgi:hypothetical protein
MFSLSTAVSTTGTYVQKEMHGCMPRPMSCRLQVTERNITANWFQGEDGYLARSEEVLIALKKGIDCFDWEYYDKKNEDMAHLPRTAQWAHFLNRGSIEFREHRWKCGLDAGAIFSSIFDN